MIKVYNVLFRLIISILIVLIFSLPAFSKKKQNIILYFFWGQGCPYCERQKEFLSLLKKKYPRLEIKDYEIWYHQASRQLLMTMSKAYGINPNGVPVTFIGDKSFIGFNEEVALKIEQTVKSCLNSRCEDPLYKK